MLTPCTLVRNHRIDRAYVVNKLIYFLKGAPGEYEKTRDDHIHALHTSSYRDRKNRNPNRVPGTCLWFENHDRFKRWRNSKSSCMLWVSANPGCGKSVLAKYLVDSVLQTGESRTTCYFFFKEDYDDQRSAKSALSCILHQLFIQNPVLLSDSIIKRFNDNKQHFTDSFDELWDLLVMASQHPNAGEIVCILDAFDECEDVDHERRRLAKALREFYDSVTETKNSVNLKFLVTSRPYGNIGRSFQPLDIEGLPIIHLKGENDEETSKIAKEINIYIKYKVSCLRNSWDLNDNETELLLNQLKRVPSQTYLWAYLTLELFENNYLISKEAIREVTSSLPQTVEDAYEKILGRSLDPDAAKKMLHIVVAAARPLTLLEMRLALAWRHDDKTYSDLEDRLVSRKRFRNYVRDICGLFVVIKNSKLYLLHQTAKEFLVSPERGLGGLANHKGQSVWKYSLRTQVSHSILYKICVGYLQFMDFKIHPFERKKDIFHYLDEHVFLEYSALNWAAHFRASGIEGVAHLQEICDPVSTRCLTWLRIYWMRRYREFPSKFTTLMIASYFGLEEMVSDQLTSGDVEVDSKDSVFQRSALSWASGKGFDGVVNLLITPPINDTGKLSLRKVAEIDTRDRRGWTPLGYAASKGHTTVVRQLTSAGADVVAENYSGLTSLYRAVFNEQEATVRLLLEHGADIEAKDQSGSTLLCRAVYARQEATVRLLLKHGADVEARNHSGRTPLCLAVYAKQKAMVRLLLKHGADVTAKDEDGETPLHYAIRFRLKAIAQLLLKYGADLEAKTDGGDMPLHYAIRFSQEAIARLLLENGANPNAKTEEGDTPLHYAITFRQEAIAQLLLKHGANLRAKTEQGDTPLHYATRFGEEALVQLLLQLRADLEAKNEAGLTPLYCAVVSSQEAMVQLLLQLGADIEAKPPGGNTPLHFAINNRSKAVVQVLLDYGADLEAKDVHGFTPLQRAVLREREDLIQLLLNHGTKGLSSHARLSLKRNIEHNHGCA